MKDKEDCWRNPDRGTAWCLEPPQDFEISRSQVTKHQHFQASGNFQNDIALVRLERPAELGRGVSFACLPGDLGLAARQLNVKDLEQGLDGKYGIVVGWGYTEFNPYQGGSQGDINQFGVAQNLQQKLEIPVMSAQTCNNQFSGRFTPAGQTGQGRAGQAAVHINYNLRYSDLCWRRAGKGLLQGIYLKTKTSRTRYFTQQRGTLVGRCISRQSPGPAAGLLTTTWSPSTFSVLSPSDQSFVATELQEFTPVSGTSCLGSKRLSEEKNK